MRKKETTATKFCNNSAGSSLICTDFEVERLIVKKIGEEKILAASAK